MNIERFIAERRPVWTELEAALRRAEVAGDKATREELQQIVELYRRAASDLNRVQSYTANPEILGYLNQLVGGAYRFVYRAEHETRIGDSLRELVLREIPAAFRRHRAAVALAALAMLFGVVVGAGAVFLNPANGARLVPGEFFTESPREHVAQVEQGTERVDTVEKALFFFAWVGPHGALELPAIVFGAAAGLVAGRALLMPGDDSRAASVRRVLPSVWRMIAGTMLTLVLAGIVEGSFSQFSSKSVPYALKIAVAVLLFAGLTLFLFVRSLREET